jgi:hypothetical protein
MDPVAADPGEPDSTAWMGMLGLSMCVFFAFLFD